MSLPEAIANLTGTSLQTGWNATPDSGYPPWRLTFYGRRTIISAMIRSFADKNTAAVFAGKTVRRIPREIQQRAAEKLALLDAASVFDDLRAPPGNRLEKLSGDRAGQWSIRINDQWRICFRFQNGDLFDVEILDYH